MSSRTDEREGRSVDELMDILRSLHPEVDFDACRTLADDRILDSFDIVTIISEIYERFDVAVPADQIVPGNFNSAQSLWALICRLEEE